jgi:hypothetical protein
MAAALHEALALDSLARAKLAAAGRRAVRARFTKEHMCAGTLGVYAEVLGHAPVPSPLPASTAAS